MERHASEPQPLSEKAELYISFDEHMEVRQAIAHAAQRLDTVAVPNVLDLNLTGIQLNGGITDYLRAQIGTSYSHMSFTADKAAAGDEDEQTHVSIWLHDDTAAKQMQLRTADTPVDFAGNKPFKLTPYGSVRSTSTINFADLCTLLDDIIPENRFNALADYHLPKSFDVASFEMGKMLIERANTCHFTRSYTSKEYSMSLIEDQVYSQVRNKNVTLNEMYVTERGARLEIAEDNGVKNYKLCMMAPLDLRPGAKAIEYYQYSFSDSPYSLAQATQPLDGRAQVTVLAIGLARAELVVGTESLQRELDATNVTLQALQLLMAENHLA